jgi:NitT/TauT family transport system substrate-binding protein
VYLAEELLRLEGFSEVQYPRQADVYAGTADFSQETAPQILTALDAGQLVVALAGVHVGCFELFAHERIHTIRDLKGRTIVISKFGGATHLLLASMLAYVGIDPHKDIKWVTGQDSANALSIFIEDKADAIMSFAPQPLLGRRAASSSFASKLPARL